MIRLVNGPLFLALLLLVGHLIAVTCAAQTLPDIASQVKEIQANVKVRAATEYIDKNREGILREWIAITEVNAPSGQEQERARFIERILRSYKHLSVRYDSAGNLIAVAKRHRRRSRSSFRCPSRHSFPTRSKNQSNDTRWTRSRAGHRR